jgi:hypothetical protein
MKPGKLAEFRRLIGDRPRGEPDWTRIGKLMFSTPARHGRGMWMLLGPQARNRGLSPEKFAMQMTAHGHPVEVGNAVLLRIADALAAAATMAAAAGIGTFTPTDGEDGHGTRG